MTTRHHVPHGLIALPLTALLIATGDRAFAQQQVPEPGGTPPPSDTESEREGERTADAEKEKREATKRKLADRIKSVQRKVFLKKNRLEVYPYFALDLNDPFFQHFVLGGAVSFHFVDSLSVEARGGGVVGSVRQDAIKLVRVTEGAIFDDPPEFQYHADLDVAWAPLYGKVSLLGEGILHFDVYVTAGPGVFGTNRGANPAVNVGIGQRYFLNDWLSARIELRDYIFVESRSNVSDVQNLLMLSLSVSGFFPTSFEYEFQ